MEQEMARAIYNRDQLLRILPIDFVTLPDSTLKNDP